MTSASGIDELAAGTAAEYLVCADMLLSGFNAFRTDQAAAYDVVADVNGRMVRIQVKGARVARRFKQAGQRHIIGYSWACRHGKRSIRSYGHGAFDVLALVALDVRRIAYLPSRATRQTIQMPISGNRKPAKRSFDACTFAAALAAGDQVSLFTEETVDGD